MLTVANVPPRTGSAMSFYSHSPRYDRKSYIPSLRMGRRRLREASYFAVRYPRLWERRSCLEGLISCPPPPIHPSTPTPDKLWGPGASLLEINTKQKTVAFPACKLGLPVRLSGGSLWAQKKFLGKASGAPHPDANTPGERQAAPPPQTRPIVRRQDTPSPPPRQAWPTSHH